MEFFFGSAERFFKSIGNLHAVIGTICMVGGFFGGVFWNFHFGTTWILQVIVASLGGILVSIPFWFVAALMYWLGEMLENVKLIREDIQSIRVDTTYTTKMTHEFYQSLKKSK